MLSDVNRQCTGRHRAHQSGGLCSRGFIDDQEDIVGSMPVGQTGDHTFSQRGSRFADTDQPQAPVGVWCRQRQIEGASLPLEAPFTLTHRGVPCEDPCPIDTVDGNSIQLAQQRSSTRSVDTRHCRHRCQSASQASSCHAAPAAQSTSSRLSRRQAEGATDNWSPTRCTSSHSSSATRTTALMRSA